LIPDEGLGWFADHPPKNIYLSIRHHYRHCGELRKEYGCKVWCAEQGLHEFADDERVQPFHFGETLPGNVKAIEIGSICPGEEYFISVGKAAVSCWRTGAFEWEMVRCSSSRIHFLAKIRLPLRKAW